MIKSINGNIRGMKVMSWNKTDRPIKDKIAEIKHCLDYDKPQILFVNELNLKYGKTRGIMNHRNYKFKVDNLIIANNIARIGAWIHTDMKYV